MMQKKPPSFSAPKPTVHTLRNVQDLGQPFEAVDPFVFATFHELDAVPENADAIGRLPFCGVVCCPVSDGEDDESSSFPSEDEDGGLGQLELDLEPIADKSTARSKVLEKELERQSRAPASAGANKGTSGETVSKQGSATRTSGGPKAKSSATPVNRKQSGTTRTSEPMLIKRKRKKEHAPTSGTNRGRGTSTSTTSPASRTTKPPLKPLLMPGFPLHPHYGVDIVTMVLQGHIDHADSLGNQARIGQGDVQWLSCGWGDETKGKTSGVFQSLMFPEVRKKLQRSHKANALRVLQIWFRLPAAAFGVGHRAASYALHWAEDVPTLDRNSTRVRVLAGRWDRKTGDAMARDFLRSSGGSQQDAMDEEIDQDHHAPSLVPSSNLENNRANRKPFPTGLTSAAAKQDFAKPRKAGKLQDALCGFDLAPQDPTMGIFVIELFWRGAQVAIPPVTHLVHKMRDETAKNGSENNTNNNNVGVSSDHDVKRTLYMIEGSKLQVDFGRVTIASSTSTSVSSRTRTSSPTRSPSSRSPSSSQKTSTIRCGKQLDLSPVQVCHVRNGGDDPVLLLLLQGRPIRERTQCQFGPLVCGSRERLVQTARRMLSKPEEEGEDGGATLAYSSGRKQHAIKPQDPSNLYSWPFSPDTEVSFPYSKSRFWKLPDGTERFPKNLDSTIEPERRKEANDDPFEEEGQAGG